MMQTTVEQATTITRQGDRGKLYFYGDIVSSWWGAWDNTDQYPERIRDFLSGQTGPLDIYINSAGGSVCACMAIYNMLSRYQGEKVVYVDGLAASAASVIALAGDKVIIPENAFFMIHHAWARVEGNIHKLENAVGMLRSMDEAMLSGYEGAAAISREKILEYMDMEKWFTGAEAAQVFHKISTVPSVEIAAKADVETLARFGNIPKGLKAAAENARAAVEMERERLALLDMKGGCQP
jgi:ATP-dependent protease ClpP protease subunit